VIKGDDGEFIIPLVPKIIIEDDGSKLVIAPSPGLLEINMP
jgi:hypothetical protein